jgi:PEP-CTERM motif
MRPLRHFARHAIFLAVCMATTAHAAVPSLLCTDTSTVVFGPATRIDCQRDLTIGPGELLATESIEITVIGDLLIEAGALLEAPNITITAGNRAQIDGRLTSTNRTDISTGGLTEPSRPPSIGGVIGVGEIVLSPGADLIVASSDTGGIVNLVQNQLDVPEPGTLGLLSLGLLAIGLRQSRRR